MIAKPIISPDFTIEDIHKIREYHYELTKDMTTQERINFYNEGGRAFLKEMEESVIVMKVLTISSDYRYSKTATAQAAINLG